VTSRYRYIAEWSGEHSWSAPDTLTVTVTESPGPAGATVLAAVGVLDLATAPVLERAVADLAPEVAVHLDLAQVTFIDSCGLRALLLLVDRRVGGVTFTSSPALDRLIELLGLTSLAHARSSASLQ
jgi:anti-anti-sigma factor